MSPFELKDVCEAKPVEDDADFRTLRAGVATGVVLVPEVHRDSEQRLLPSDAGDFVKWLRQKDSSLAIVKADEGDGRVLRRSSEWWLPLVYLAGDMTLQIYLNLVASYLYDKMRGSLAGDKHRVHLSAVYEETPSKRTMRFDYEGDAEALKSVIEKLDFGRFPQ